MAYTLPDLAYDYGALEPHMSGRILELHHGKHHRAYVDGANTALDALAEARSKNDFASINQLERNLAFNVSGHVLHSTFWTNMYPDGGGKPETALADAIDTDFGSFDSFREHMSKVAVGVQGSGWATLAWEPLGGRLVIEQVQDHQSNLTHGSLPLLVIDVWEHVYYLQYENRRADFVEAFWNIVHWDDVAERFDAARAVRL